MDEYARIAPVYDLLVGSALRPIHRAVVHTLLAHGAASVVDLCCGTGLFAAEAVRAGIRTVGVDVSPTMIGTARRKRPALDFRRENAMALYCPDDSFDAASVTFALHEKPDETGLAMLREARRVVRPGGLLVVADYRKPRNRAFWTGLSIRCVERLAGREHHACFRKYMAAGGAPELLARTGFTARLEARFLRGWAGVFSAVMHKERAER